MNLPTYYIGLMSGTSADAVDAVAVEFLPEKNRSQNKLALIERHSLPLPQELREKIHALASPSDNEIDRLGELDQELGEFFATTINQLMQKSKLQKVNVAAIGSHGQTIRHRPPGSIKHPFSLQIGDPNIIAQRTGITTVADFRRRDMAAGGQGAPLVPAFHHFIFHSNDIDRVIVNIGGMANISWLPSSGDIIGFDTGPGNVLMDAWTLKNLNMPYDQNGKWGASGEVHQKLLDRLLQHSFFVQPPPKSTGREVFNLQWLEAEIATLGSPPKVQDVQATLVALTATTIRNCIYKLSERPAEIFIGGGGAYNLRLMDELQRQLPNSSVVSTASLGIEPEWIEAIAFAWLAKQTMNRQPGNLRAVTGASKEVILGGVYFS